MKNKIAVIEALQKKINSLQEQIYKISRMEEENIQLPRCRAMIGWCLKSTYGEFTYAKILEFVETKNKYYTFIFEYISISKDGIPTIQLYSQSPYLNKEWWEAEVPLHGWKHISNLNFENAKVKIIKEMNSRNMLRKHICK